MGEETTPKPDPWSALKTRKWPPSASTLECCIIIVPDEINKANKEAFIPQAVSIGPLHHGNEKLEQMESKKIKYLEYFVDRYAVNIDCYYEKVKKLEDKARAFYKSKNSLNSDEFVKMTVKDGIFIFEILVRKIFSDRLHSEDEILNSPSLMSDVLRDLILIENQLPFFVLKELYDVFNRDLPWNNFLHGVATEYLKNGVSITKVTEALVSYNVKHLPHFLHLLCVLSIPREQGVPSRRPKVELSRSATKLNEAGVKFVRAEKYLPFDLHFEEKEYPVCFGSTMEGVFRIPPLTVTGWTESFFRNLIAYEHYHRSGHKLISSYIILMGCLIHDSKDVELLVECKIIENSLGTSEDICHLFSNLYKRNLMDDNEFYYTPSCERLNIFSTQQVHQWRAASYKGYKTFKETYCSTPCAIVSLLVGIILFALTVGQGLYSFLSKK